MTQAINALCWFVEEEPPPLLVFPVRVLAPGPLDPLEIAGALCLPVGPGPSAGALGPGSDWWSLSFQKRNISAFTASSPGLLPCGLGRPDPPVIGSITVEDSEDQETDQVLPEAAALESWDLCASAWAAGIGLPRSSPAPTLDFNWRVPCCGLPPWVCGRTQDQLMMLEEW